MDNCILWSAVFILIYSTTAVAHSDPYDTLGVNTAASVSEIKAAYKRLVREWHPDRNTSPEAEHKFIEVQEAYELLNDPLKRAHYDRTGSWEQADSHSQHSMDDMLRDQMFASQFNRGDNEASKGYARNRITLRMYENNVLAQSYRKPYLLFVHSDWCAPCFRYFSKWDSIRQDMESVGYSMGTVNRMLDGTLSDRLRARSLPCFIGLVEGRTFHFRGNLMKSKEVIDFARSIIPTHFMSIIKDAPSLRTFINSWQTSNKVSIVMVGPRQQPRLRFSVASMSYSEHARFAYIPISHMRDSTQMRHALDLNNPEDETVLVFNDQPELGPVARLSAHASISTSQLREMIENNKHLILPRVSSQDRFDRLCPVSGGRQMQLCAILIVDTQSDSDNKHVQSFRTYLHDATLKKPSNVKFVYMFEGTQHKWLTALQHSDAEKSILVQSTDNDPTNHGTEHDYKDVLVVRRVSSSAAQFVWLRNAWNGLGQAANHSAALLNQQLVALLQGKVSLTDQAPLSHVVDEHAYSWLHRVSHRTMRVWEAFIFHATKEELLAPLSALGTLAFIMVLGYGLNYLASREIDERASEQERLKRAERQRKKDQGIKPQPYDDVLRELRAETYYGMVRLLKPGCRTLVCLVSAETKDVLLPEFRRCIWPWRNNKTLMFGYVMIEKNSAWFKEVLAYTLPIENVPGEAPSTLQRRLDTINPKQTVGTVLSINGWRLYLCMYHPKHAESMQGYRPKQARNSAKHFMGFDDADSTSDSENDNEARLEARQRFKKEQQQSKLYVEDLLSGLPNWLDRLFEGQTRRYYVPEWPKLK